MYEEKRSKPWKTAASVIRMITSCPGVLQRKRAWLRKLIVRVQEACKPAAPIKTLQAVREFASPHILRGRNIFQSIQKVALPDRLPARLAAYAFWSLLLVLLMLLLGAVALAVAVALALSVAVAVTDFSLSCCCGQASFGVPTSESRGSLWITL